MNRSIRSMSLAATLLASGILSGLGSAEAQSLPPGVQQVLPKGAQVASGTIAISQPWPDIMSVKQSSQTAIVNWQSFSIGQGGVVAIDQPNAQAVILNRVTGSTPSTIDGALSGKGQIYLVNPNGIAITRSGEVSAAGGFVASTLDIADKDFNEGRRTFRGSGSPAAVTNDGTISNGLNGRGGYVALIGGQVSNTGTITVPMGKVGLGSGQQATLDLSGNGFLQVALAPTRDWGGVPVSNAGTIAANGGTVTLAAAKVREVGRLAVNLSGTIEARSVSGQNGNIVLDAGYGGGGLVLTNQGARIDASGTGGENGGKVTITGDNVFLAGTIDVSGAKGGAASIQARQRLIVASKIRAVGQGGSISLRADTGVIGLLAAQFEMSGNSKPEMKYRKKYVIENHTY